MLNFFLPTDFIWEKKVRTYVMKPAELIFNTPLKSSRSSLGRVFIYALTVNNPENPMVSLPYYLGTTSQLNKRLSNHAQVNWHVNVFKVAPKVEVYGTCDIDNALAAVKDLTKAFAHQGHFLNSASNVLDHTVFGETSENSSGEPRKIVVPEEWYTKWDIRQGGKRKPSSENQFSSMVGVVETEQVEEYLNSIFKGEDLRTYLDVLEHFSVEAQGIVMPYSDYRWGKLNAHPKRNKIFAYPPKNEAHGVKVLPLQKSVVTKIIKQNSQ